MTWEGLLPEYVYWIIAMNFKNLTWNGKKKQVERKLLTMIFEI